ncbi:MAG: Enoyl-CoA hydratase [uncultured Cytophagales bacterium]|uniref:Enoyl-CoA hydratase n=1 Tax=uncultured Cytophagales bacterium TaxID=158755 RepID=A0A6J4JQK1_9SPHI|nr:MAG: Enoyl-CoA hydratase [uncultured Cytophagales bacterium]
MIARDRDNKVVILTGTGNEFFARIDGPGLGDITNPREWDKTWWEGQQRAAQANFPRAETDQEGKRDKKGNKKGKGQAPAFLKPVKRSLSCR